MHKSETESINDFDFEEGPQFKFVPFFLQTLGDEYQDSSQESTQTQSSNIDNQNQKCQKHKQNTKLLEFDKNNTQNNKGQVESYFQSTKNSNIILNQNKLQEVELKNQVQDDEDDDDDEHYIQNQNVQIDKNHITLQLNSPTNLLNKMNESNIQGQDSQSPKNSQLNQINSKFKSTDYCQSSLCNKPNTAQNLQSKKYTQTFQNQYSQINTFNFPSNIRTNSYKIPQQIQKISKQKMRNKSKTQYLRSLSSQFQKDRIFQQELNIENSIINETQDKILNQSKLSIDKISQPNIEKSMVIYKIKKTQSLHKNLPQDKEKQFNQEFKISQALQIFFICILFFAILGPFFVLLNKLIYRNTYLSRNLQMYGLHKFTVLSYIIYFFNVFFILTLFTIDYKITREYLYLVVGTLICQIQLLIFYSISYGYTYTPIFNKLKTDLVNQKEELDLLTKWGYQDDETIEKYIEMSLRKQEIEKSLFYFEFMTKIKPEVKEKVSNYRYQANLCFANKFRFMKDDTLYKTKEVYGPYILKDFMQYFRKKIQYKKTKLKSIKLVVLKQVILIYSIITTIIQYPQDLNIQFIIFLILNLIFQILGSYIIYKLLLLYQLEMKRKLFLMSQLSNLISPKKQENLENYKKLYPTINLLCLLSLRAWENLRKITLDYGSTFFIRLSLMLSFYAFYSFIIVALVIIQLFNFIPQVYSNRGLASTSVDFLVLIVLFITSLYYGANVNKQLILQQQLIIKNKNIYTDLLQNKYIYFQNQLTKMSNPGVRNLVLSAYKMKHIFNLTDEAADQYLQMIIRAYDFSIKELDLIIQYTPFKILRIPITSKLVLQVSLGLLVLFLYSFLEFYRYFK